MLKLLFTILIVIPFFAGCGSDTNKGNTAQAQNEQSKKLTGPADINSADAKLLTSQAWCAQYSNADNPKELGYSRFYFNVNGQLLISMGYRTGDGLNANYGTPFENNNKGSWGLTGDLLTMTDGQESMDYQIKFEDIQNSKFLFLAKDLSPNPSKEWMPLYPCN